MWVRVGFWEIVIRILIYRKQLTLQRNLRKQLEESIRNNNISANYTKSDEKHFEYLKEFISTAVDNADFSYQSHIIKQGKNPNNACSCTNVFELVKRLNLISQNKMF
jgi:hypothetical protein